MIGRVCIGDLKNRNGITLIALIITIIVLLILAGVSIATLTGEDGLIKKAGKAEDITSNAQNEENIRISNYENIIDSIFINNRESNSANIVDILKYLAGEIENSEYDKQIDQLVNSNESMQEICSSSELFSVCASSKVIMEKICGSSIARNAMYDNYAVTESILAASSIAKQAMQESSQYEVVNAYMATSFNTLYDGKAFVLGVSQNWHNGAVAVTMTHGQYISGNATYTYSGGGTGNTHTGLGIIVNKFASIVQQKNSYGNSSGSYFYSAIFKID